MSTKKKARPRTALSPTPAQRLIEVPNFPAAKESRRQYGALCFRHADNGDVEVLVLTSRDTGRWVVPKGWPIKRKKPYESAAIEAWEEAGIKGTIGKSKIGHYSYLKLMDDGNVVPCTVDLFQLEAKELHDDFKEKGERSLAWVSPVEAAQRVREIELKALLVQFDPVQHRRRRGAIDEG